MLVFLSNSPIPAPGLPWRGGETVPVDIAVDPQTEIWMNWLSERWLEPMPDIAAEMLVFCTSGRYVLSQLNAHHILAPQCGVISSSRRLRLRLLKPTAELLLTSAPSGLPPESAGQLIQNHLQGLFNPQRASIAQPDPDGESLRKDDASLTIHLPQEFENRVDMLAGHHELTKSDVLRNILLLHVYGRIRYELWTSEGSWRPKRKATSQESQDYRGGRVLFSRTRATADRDEPSILKSTRRSEFIREHGKSGDGARVFMPALLKQRLEELATKARRPTSEYCRRRLVELI